MSRFAATEAITLERATEKLPKSERYVGTVVSRIRDHLIAKPNLNVLDIGAAQGRGLIALNRLGFTACGVEPWDEAREVAKELAAQENCQIQIEKGWAEDIPFGDDSFDLVIAMSVMEHVVDLEKSLAEIYRVLRPGGLFWFNSASSVCPRQNEIGAFPAFGWYPDAIKRKIMIWAQHNKPELVGYTEAPALHWWTPSKANRLLRGVGFNEIWDRWDLRKLEEESGLRQKILRSIKQYRLARFFADVAVGGCSYAARKNPM